MAGSLFFSFPTLLMALGLNCAEQSKAGDQKTPAEGVS
jgi:hypothetical protein